MRLALCPSLVLTDEGMAGANRIPVLILSDGTADQPAYRPHDSLKFAGHVMPAAHWTKLFGELKQEPKDREFIAQFLKSWPQGPQLSTPAGAHAPTRTRELEWTGTSSAIRCEVTKHPPSEA